MRSLNDNDGVVFIVGCEVTDCGMNGAGADADGAGACGMAYDDGAGGAAADCAGGKKAGIVPRLGINGCVVVGWRGGG